MSKGGGGKSGGGSGGGSSGLSRPSGQGAPGSSNQRNILGSYSSYSGKSTNLIQDVPQNQIFNHLLLLRQNKKSNGIYYYLSNIDRKYLLYYFFIGIVLFNMIDYLNFSIKQFISFMVMIFFIYVINDMNSFNSINEMEEIELKLNSIIPKPDNFHLDSGIIELIYDISVFRQFNEPVFDKLVELIDNFLKIKLYALSDDKYYVKHLETLKTFKNKILNHLQSLTITIPDNEEPKLQKTVNTLHKILNIHIDEIKNLSISRNNENDITIDYNIVKSDDNIASFSKNEYNDKFDIY